MVVAAIAPRVCVCVCVLHGLHLYLPACLLACLPAYLLVLLLTFKKK